MALPLSQSLSGRDSLPRNVRISLNSFGNTSTYLHGIMRTCQKDPQVATHQLNIDPKKKPFKQPQRRFRPAMMEAIETEVKKLIDLGFIREEHHPDWVANVVPVAKKNGKIRICIDFRNLNDA